MPAKQNIYGWDGTQWVAILVNAAGKLIIDPSEILEDTPTDGEVAKAPTSNWAHDHEANPTAHQTKTKEFFVPVEYPTGGDAAWGLSGRHPGILIDAATEYVYTEFHVPWDFTSIVSALIIAIVQAANIDAAYPMKASWYTNYGALDEGYQAHTDSLLNSANVEGHATLGDFISWDISAELGSLAAGDFVGVGLLRSAGDAANNETNCRVLGILFRYS